MLQNDQIQAEQAYVDGLFARLDAAVEAAQERLRQVTLNIDPANPKAESLVQRETDYHALNERLDKLNLATLGLVFGRIDIADTSGSPDNPVPGHPELDRRYIGRIGLDAREDNYRTLLLDWRAPMARPFYLATTAHPEGVTMRRHIRTHGRKVTAISDEHLGDQEIIDVQDIRSDIGGESALRYAMSQARTGRMRNIVETIQREQDQIIRDETRGVLMVEGGPGTGKTAVALHRIAYLLYTWREQLSRSGVLIIGPNTVFLDYISQVLPELGETGVVLSTIPQLYPGLEISGTDSLLAKEIKGSAEMVHILSNAVKYYQQVPDSAQIVRIGSLRLAVTPSMVKKARTRARRSRKPHNLARAIFREALLHFMAEALAELIGADPLGGANLLSTADIDQLHDDLSEEPEVLALLDKLWPQLEPFTVLAELLGDFERINQVAGEYDTDTHTGLYRENATAWSFADAALLDELAVLIGIPDPEEEKLLALQKQRIAEAQEALDILESSNFTDNEDEEFDAEYLAAHDVIDAQTLAERQIAQDQRTTAERAQADQQWAYGHVIVDEAQELSPMEWRMVFRRNPARWMTLVGDTAQTGSPAGVDSWAETLQPFVDKRFKHHTLTINYRTPKEIMALANKILAIIDPAAEPTTAIRESGYPVQILPTGSNAENLVAELAVEERTVKIINAANIEEIKGLEFDHIIVENPQAIVEASPQGWQNLYVATTRATQSLTLIGELPDPLVIESA
ncbi:HelD family protein [Corynebacterium caspium]|uniref:HelD family protein n=1 Tax=Corynebacterium caspium TaxID=234828 RepID=UPI000363FB44|nr:UvrD-helicase domain-containing protein [Corynebacterium caspium]WKD59378.1 Helicase IV [Corynebacterium caspium DSM 44850]